VQRPVLCHRHHHNRFPAIFTLQRVEAGSFTPWLTVAFALLGALLFSILVAPCWQLRVCEGAKEWHNQS